MLNLDWAMVSSPGDGKLECIVGLCYISSEATDSKSKSQKTIFKVFLLLLSYSYSDSLWHSLIGNPILEIWSYDSFISTVCFPVLVRWHLDIESRPRSCYGMVSCNMILHGMAMARVKHGSCFELAKGTPYGSCLVSLLLLWRKLTV